MTLRLLFVSVCLVTSSIGANMMALALFLVIRPFSRSLYRRLVSQCVACMWIDALSLLLPGTNIHIAADSDMPDGITAGIVVANHQYEGDWWFMLMVARFLGLHGNVKIIVREGLKKIPLLGWLVRLVEYPFISSSWSLSRTNLFGLLRSFNADDFPVLLFQFPEGDRIDAKVRQQSLAFAAKEQRPHLLHVLLPRTTGFNTCIEALRTSHPPVYDMTIAIPGTTGQPSSSSSSSSPSAAAAAASPSAGAAAAAAAASNTSTNPSSNPPSSSSTDTSPAAAAAAAADAAAAESHDASLFHTFLRFCNGEGPRDVHIRLKRYSLNDVLADPHWLDTKWAEKDRVLTYFSRHACFPAPLPPHMANGGGSTQTHGGRGGPRGPAGSHAVVGAAGNAQYLRSFNSRKFKAETSFLALARLLLTPLCLPLLLLMACPLMTLYVCVSTVRRWLGEEIVFSPGGREGGREGGIPRVSSRGGDGGRKEGLNGGEESVTPLPIPTPFLPQTPFTSPLIGAFELGAGREGGREGGGGGRGGAGGGGGGGGE
ncbi:hypothetical protein VYU27_007133, partial [Nannochloropsis oceanica]